ncbi:glycosyltransferase family 4 protein [Phenylobacterium aquaticum]|uniref:glycosyltransferase family 4 protein n=1 Tax=Phenylobacterium aquaticum TaxID=1763816 RepID=UPI0026F2E6D6|nr:glycosyltransferase family 4 protein [Phenylobacterium aquaticum]
MVKPLNFAITYTADSFSTAGKIMGRQSAGQGLLKAIVDTWPNGDLHALGLFPGEADQMRDQLLGWNFKGHTQWHRGYLHGRGAALDALYWPAPVNDRIAHLRNSRGPASQSLFGVTHTLSSRDAMDTVSRQTMAPFQPWDALICTSQVAYDVVTRLQAEYRDWAAAHLGATRFVDLKLPVIPLGADLEALRRTPASIARARTSLGLAADETAFLFAGRLVFHAKANPAPLYQALEAVARRTGRKLVMIEAGVFPAQAVSNTYRAAQQALAPSVRFLHVDGADPAAYAGAWQAADVFTSLSDNIQETFGLTPVEAMAAGLPVLVSDWNGYKDTVRDGIDGFRITTISAPPGAGGDLAFRYAAEIDSYDHFVGRVSMSTVVDIDQLTDRVALLVEDPALRQRLGAAGRARAKAEFSWSRIVLRYVDLARELGELRRAAPPQANIPWPTRPDPFELFQSYPTQVLDLNAPVAARAAGDLALDALLDLGMANALLDAFTPHDTIRALHRQAQTGEQTAAALLDACGGPTPGAIRSLMWLAKFGLLRLG